MPHDRSPDHDADDRTPRPGSCDICGIRRLRSYRQWHGHMVFLCWRCHREACRLARVERARAGDW